MSSPADGPRVPAGPGAARAWESPAALPSSPPRIVVGVDGSPSSVQALHHAERLATGMGWRIEAVAVWQYQPAFGTFTPRSWHPDQDAEAVLARTLSQAFGENPPAGLTARAVRGQPAQVLIEASRDARMLVVGSRGHGGFAGLLLGSVSSACAKHAGCPVLVIHDAGLESR